MSNIEKIVWKLFEQTGQIGYFMLFHSLQEDAKLELKEYQLKSQQSERVKE